MRALRRHPGYALANLATVTLAVGANLVVFSFVNALWLKPRAVTDIDRVVVVGRDFDIPDGSRYSESGLEGLRATGAFEAVAGQVVTTGMFEGLQRRLAIPGVEQPVESAYVTPDYFAVLGVHVSGRVFEPGEGQAPGSSPAILSDRLWRTAFRSRPDVLGLPLATTAASLYIVGVAAPGFQGARLGERTDIWLPHRLAPQLAGQDVADLRNVTLPMLAFARMRPGASIEQTRAVLAQGPRGPADLAPLSRVFGAADLPTVRLGGEDAMTLSAIMAAFVLASGCATLVALALVHYERRHRELSIRAALGASRRRLAGQLSLELVGLAIGGTVAAVLVAGWMLRALPTFSLPGGVDFSRLDLTMDWRVALAGLGGCVATLAAAVAGPVMRFTGAAVSANLMSSTATPPRSSMGLRRAILTAHVGLTTLVLLSAVLFVSSVTGALSVGPGFDPDRVVFAAVATRYRFLAGESSALEARKARDVARSLEVVDRIGAIPGVQAVALGPAPLGVEREDHSARPRIMETDGARLHVTAGWMFVGTNYLEALGAQVAAGRWPGRDEAVVTPAFARVVWGDDSPVGQRLTFGELSTTVTGVADVAFGTMREGAQPAVFYTGQTSVASMVKTRGELALVIRTDRTETVKAAVARLLGEAFPDNPARVTSGRDLVSTDLGRERMNAWIFSGFGLVTLMLATVSVFGLVAYVVEMRRREFAIRMALGATLASVAMRVCRTSLEPVALGAVGGLIAALALGRTIEAYLFGQRAVEPVSYMAVFVGVVACAALAAAVAGRRILTVSVAESLRQG